MTGTIEIRRTVPCIVLVHGEEFSLTINDMRPPDVVVIGVTTAGGGTLHRVRKGDQIGVGTSIWQVQSVVAGDRGTVRLEQIEDGGQ